MQLRKNIGPALIALALVGDRGRLCARFLAVRVVEQPGLTDDG